MHKDILSIPLFCPTPIQKPLSYSKIRRGPIKSIFFFHQISLLFFHKLIFYQFHLLDFPFPCGAVWCLPLVLMSFRLQVVSTHNHTFSIDVTLAEFVQQQQPLYYVWIVLEGLKCLCCWIYFTPEMLSSKYSFITQKTELKSTKSQLRDIPFLGGHSAHVSMVMELTRPYNVILLSLIWEKQAWTYPTNTFNKTPPDRQSSRIWNLKSSGRNKNNQRDKNTRQSAQSEKNSSRQCYAVGLVAPGCLSDRFEPRQPSSIQSVQQLSSQALISTGGEEDVGMTGGRGDVMDGSWQEA